MKICSLLVSKQANYTMSCIYYGLYCIKEVISGLERLCRLAYTHGLR